MKHLPLAGCLIALVFLPRLLAAAEPTPAAEPLAGTQPLTWTGDLASRLVDGVDQFLLKKLAASIAERADTGNAIFRRPRPTVGRLNRIVSGWLTSWASATRGLPSMAWNSSRPRRSPPRSDAGRGTRSSPSAGRSSARSTAKACCWCRTERERNGNGKTPAARVIAIPDADQTPEAIGGLADGVPAASQFARRLAESGCRVLVPTLISRELQARRAARS